MISRPNSAFAILLLLLPFAQTVGQAQESFDKAPSPLAQGQYATKPPVKGQILPADPSPASPEKSAKGKVELGKYIGNNHSHIFHRRSCPFAHVMWKGRRVQFLFRRQAVAAGHTPCRYCLPQAWKEVKAVVLREMEKAAPKND